MIWDPILSQERLASLFRKKFWRRNEQLLVEGTPAKELHVVAQGDVSIILGGKVGLRGRLLASHPLATP